MSLIWNHNQRILLTRLPAVWPHAHVDTACSFCLTSAKPPLPLLPASHRCASFYCSFCVVFFFFFKWMTSVCFAAVPSFIFSLTLPLTIFPSPGPLFFHFTRLQQCYCNYLSERQGLLSPSRVHFRNNHTALFLHISSSEVVPSHLPAYVYVFLSRSPLTVKLATSSSLSSLAEWGAECWHWILSKYVVYGAGRR